jgi:hypothetical protein
MEKKDGFAYCPRCWTLTVLEKHHILPKHLFLEKSRGHKIFICPNCHDSITRVLAKLTKLTEVEYINLHKAFIQHKSYDLLRCIRQKK